ncbi:Ref family recombination enhancement nuclease [Paracoccus yeei]|uniref:Ref family recombination enhancement nuclease n=1 Tax=Paracoccus yeei TaxID=147645 RepID=UPI0028D8AA94|nr:Ref family recombination enhancement nuclease [Paracoccus yeei]
MNARFGDLAGRGPLGPKAAKPVRGTAEARRHMARLAQLPCVICKAPAPSEVHHVIHGRFSQRRSSDFETIPLCPSCHRVGPRAIHQDKAAWLAAHGPDWGFLPLVRALLDETTEIDF